MSTKFKQCWVRLSNTVKKNALIPKDARRTVILYFYGSKIPVIIITLLITHIPQYIVSRIGLLIDMVTGTTSLQGIFSVATCIILLVVALIISLLDRFKKNPKAEAEIDAFIQADLAGFMENAVHKIGIVEEQIFHIDPINMTGPYNKQKGAVEESVKKEKRILPVRIYQFIKNFLISIFTYPQTLVAKEGADGEMRYSLIKASIHYFSEDQMYVYSVCYDLARSYIFEESTVEYFYENMDKVTSGAKKIEMISQGKKISKETDYLWLENQKT